MTKSKTILGKWRWSCENGIKCIMEWACGITKWEVKESIRFLIAFQQRD